MGNRNKEGKKFKIGFHRLILGGASPEKLLYKLAGFFVKVGRAAFNFIRQIVKQRGIGIPYGPEVDTLEAHSHKTKHDRGLLFVSIDRIPPITY